VSHLRSHYADATRGSHHLPELRDLAPQGVCDPPNPWVYQQLAKLCEGDAALFDVNERSRRIHELVRDDLHHHFVSEDPDTRPYLWELPEDCTCR